MAADTIEVRGFFGKPKHVTRDAFIETWVAHAAQLSEVMPLGDLLTEVRQKAGERFDECFARQNKEDEKCPA